MAGRRGRPPKDKTPTNINAADAADALRRASGKIVQAEEAVDAAKAPLRDAKAAVKAAGIDYDIFALIHKIRTLDDDDKRQSRIRKLKLTCAALLGDVETGDLFGGLDVSLSPAAELSLREASDRLAEDEVDEVADDDESPWRDAAELDRAARTAPVDAPVDAADPAPITLAADMPAGAGAAYNLGVDAWVSGMDESDCPFGDDDDARRDLWVRGFRAAESGDEKADDERDDDEAVDIVPPFDAARTAPVDALPAAE